MTRYLISFDDGAMTFPEEEMPDVADAPNGASALTQPAWFAQSVRTQARPIRVGAFVQV